MNRFLRPLSFLVIVAAGAAGASMWQPSPADPQQPGPTVVTEFARACPIQVNPTAVAAGEAVVRSRAQTSVTLLPGGEALDDLRIGGGWSEAMIKNDAVRAVELRRSDDDGAGFVAFAAATGRNREGGGLAVTDCPAAQAESWFVGAGSTVRHRSTLVLTNLGDSTAVADLEVVGTNGAVESVSAEGIVVDAGKTRHINLADLAAGEAQLGVHVVIRRGAMSTVMRDSSTADSKGSEWIPRTRDVAREQIVSAIPAGAKGRQLLIVNPGSETAAVEVEVIGKDGAIVADDFDQLKVDAGSLKSFDVPGSVGSEALSLRLRSKVPIVASVRVAPTTSDFAYAAAGQAIAQPAVVPLAIGGLPAGVGSRLIVTAGRKPSIVRFEAFNAKRVSQGSVELKVAANHTDTINLSKKGLFDSDAGDISFMVAKPSQPIRGAVEYRGPKTISVLPLIEAPLTVLAPTVERGR